MSVGGRKVQEEGNIRVHITDSIYSTAETNTRAEGEEDVRG